MSSQHVAQVRPRQKIDLFSIDTLVKMLSQAGIVVQLQMRDHRTKAKGQKAA